MGSARFISHYTLPAYKCLKMSFHSTCPILKSFRNPRSIDGIDTKRNAAALGVTRTRERRGYCWSFAGSLPHGGTTAVRTTSGDNLVFLAYTDHRVGLVGGKIVSRDIKICPANPAMAKPRIKQDTSTTNIKST
jgi:hypothetical protein